MAGEHVTRADASPLDISRMGGPQRAEREGAALMEAAERTTSPKVAPPTFEEVGCHNICC